LVRVVFIETPTFTKRVTPIGGGRGLLGVADVSGKASSWWKGDSGFRRLEKNQVGGERTGQTWRIAGDLLLVGGQRPHLDVACLSEERAGRFERGSSETTSER
jgi:hypothetical protein